MYISLLTVPIPLNYTSEFWELFESTTCIWRPQHPVVQRVVQRVLLNVDDWWYETGFTCSIVAVTDKPVATSPWSTSAAITARPVETSSFSLFPHMPRAWLTSAMHSLYYKHFSFVEDRFVVRIGDCVSFETLWVARFYVATFWHRLVW